MRIPSHVVYKMFGSLFPYLLDSSNDVVAMKLNFVKCAIRVCLCNMFHRCCDCMWRKIARRQSPFILCHCARSLIENLHTSHVQMSLHLGNSWIIYAKITLPSRLGISQSGKSPFLTWKSTSKPMRGRPTESKFHHCHLGVLAIRNNSSRLVLTTCSLANPCPKSRFLVMGQNSHDCPLRSPVVCDFCLICFGLPAPMPLLGIV